jgi:hypothetical protein
MFGGSNKSRTGNATKRQTPSGLLDHCAQDEGPVAVSLIKPENRRDIYRTRSKELDRRRLSKGKIRADLVQLAIN